jgi:hypothetical protein
MTVATTAPGITNSARNPKKALHTKMIGCTPRLMKMRNRVVKMAYPINAFHSEPREPRDFVKDFRGVLALDCLSPPCDDPRILFQPPLPSRTKWRAFHVSLYGGEYQFDIII